MGPAVCVIEKTEPRRFGEGILALCESATAGLHYATPDFLSIFVVSIDRVRLSLLKAAYVAVD